MPHDAFDIARRSLLLKNAPTTLIEALLQPANLVTIARGATLFLQDDPADTIYIVIDGWVKLYRIGLNGNEAVVGVFTRGHSIGEAVALGSETYPVSAQAVTDSEVLRIDARLLLRLLESDPKIAIAMLTATYAHLRNLVTQVEQLKSRTGPQRVAEFLLDLASCKNGACEVKLPYDKVLIAGRLGMTPESLSRAFSKLIEFGVTIRQNAAQINDIATLQAYAELDPVGNKVR